MKITAIIRPQSKKKSSGVLKIKTLEILLHFIKSMYIFHMLHLLNVFPVIASNRKNVFFFINALVFSFADESLAFYYEIFQEDKKVDNKEGSK